MSQDYGTDHIKIGKRKFLKIILKNLDSSKDHNYKKNPSLNQTIGSID